jgi:hypothetical protein
MLPTIESTSTAFLMSSHAGTVQHIPKYPNMNSHSNMSKRTHCGVTGVWVYKEVKTMAWCATCIKRCPSMTKSLDGI